MLRRAWLRVWLSVCQFFYDEALASGDEECLRFWQRRIEAAGRWGDG